MSARATNLSLLLLVIVQLVSGLGSLTVGSPSGRWVFWAHSVGGLSLVVLLGWKWRIILRSLTRRQPGPWLAAPMSLAILFLGALGSGLLWSTVGLPSLRLPILGRVSGLTLHVLLSLLLVPPLVVHLAVRWPRLRRADIASRRAVLRTLGVLGGGAVAWRAVETGSTVLALPGASRRFTGSHERASREGNDHPVTNWLTDQRQVLDAGDWRLRLTGHVARQRELRYEELLAVEQAAVETVLDCTGGWYTVQHWSGVRLDRVLQLVGGYEGARTIVVRSVTGYSRRFPLTAAPDLLLATHVEGEPLSPGHGFPARLVAPGYRGFHWVKWVEEIEVSTRPAWWQPPLPLQ